MSKDQSASSCEKHLVENVRSKTNDRQAHTDCARPHRAWKRGWDRVKGETVLFSPIKPYKLTWEDVCVWRERMLSAGMKQSSLNAYDSALKRAWELVYCDCPDQGSVKNATNETEFIKKSEINNEISSLKSVLVGKTTGTDKTRIGFKLSVCQKSLSLALKHAWAHNQMTTPPVCPIDRIILDLSSKITGKRWLTNWTDVNSLEEYENHLALVHFAASSRSVADWEILSFEHLIPAEILNPDDAEGELALDTEGRIQEAKLSFIRRFSGGAQGHEDWPDQMLKDCLRSSLQHNGTYLSTTPEAVKVQVRAAMRAFIIDFLIRWEECKESERTVKRFENEMLAFQKSMNSQFLRWFR